MEWEAEVPIAIAASLPRIAGGVGPGVLPRSSRLMDSKDVNMVIST